jgi:hypothetical protein
MQSAAVLGLCGAGFMGFGTMNAALAAPPAAPRATFHLDLRPSIAAIAAVTKLGPDKPTEAFPSSLHRQPWAAQPQLQLPGLSAQGPQPRITSPMEEFTRRVRKEGLPVARLWENKSALVSLGLNQKGKPGLWIVQKIH